MNLRVLLRILLWGILVSFVGAVSLKLIYQYLEFKNVCAQRGGVWWSGVPLDRGLGWESNQAFSLRLVEMPGVGFVRYVDVFNGDEIDLFRCDSISTECIKGVKKRPSNKAKKTVYRFEPLTVTPSPAVPRTAGFYFAVTDTRINSVIFTYTWFVYDTLSPHYSPLAITYPQLCPKANDNAAFAAIASLFLYK